MKEIRMSMLVRFTPASEVTKAQYDEVTRQLEAQGDFPPDGLEYHVAFMVDGDIRVSEIWESEAKFAAFGERLMPLLTANGIRVNPPEILEIHNIISG
jgi:hypothetical protein